MTEQEAEYQKLKSRKAALEDQIDALDDEIGDLESQKSDREEELEKIEAALKLSIPAELIQADELAEFYERRERKWIEAARSHEFPIQNWWLHVHGLNGKDWTPVFLPMQ